ncbi:MAG: ABC transporter ATP-binding protein [Candidatus Pacebacteria bacterium]|nr:ABC transporter ATP-binding protein [Candidatus Paceibacterota bacterium]MBP9851278.1 ABC transporter ATP-binding protein [Candidatus Paceibacterota bacterium]
MQTLYSYLKKYWKLCIAVLALATVNQVFSLIDPLIFQRIIDEYASKPDAYTSAEFFAGVVKLLLIAIGVVFVSRIAKNLQDYYLNMVTQRSGADMYQSGVRHSLLLPYEVFEDQRSGETLGVLQKARADAEKYLGLLINIVFISLIGFIFVSIYAATLYWGVALVYALTIPVVGGLSYFLTKKVKQMQKQIVAETTALAGSTTESLRNIELVKSLGLAEQEIQRLNNTTTKILNLELKKLRYIRSISFVQGTMINLIRNSILLFLLYLVFSKIITFGQFFSLYIYSFFVFGPLQEVGAVITAYREAQTSMEKFKSIVDIPVEIVPKSPTTLNKVEDLAFNDVSFKYKNANTEALENISFSMHKGDTVAFVGPSGSGKTSLVKLLVGLYQPVKGEVLYNNTSSRNIDLEELRSQIGFVTQDTQLFAGTIKENLLFVNPQATDAEMLEVLKKSACDTLLARADKGLDTTIGEGGVKISGGEKQRLSIARALLRKPTILVFDEATSSLDSITEEEITKTVKDLGGNREHLTILIAHRLSTIMHADKIYVLEKGILSESGTHLELLALKGLYYAMWRQQVGER